jgi:hypothetical protein
MCSAEPDYRSLVASHWAAAAPIALADVHADERACKTKLCAQCGRGRRHRIVRPQ